MPRRLIAEAAVRGLPLVALIEVILAHARLQLAHGTLEGVDLLEVKLEQEAMVVGDPTSERFDQLRTNSTAAALLSGAGPAAIGAILGAAVPLALAIGEAWQYAVLGGAAISLLVLRRSVLVTLLAAAAIGLVATQLGAPMP